MPLYPKQAQTVANLCHIYNTPNHISNGHLFISGEMGVGKTYMASAIINKLHAKKTLISCPATVAKKWLKVAKEYNPDKEIKIYDKKMTNLPDIIIVKQKDIFKFAIKFLFNDNYEAEDDQGHVYSTEKPEDAFRYYQNAIARASKRDNNKLVYRNTSISDAQLNDIFDLAIFDEIHLYQPTHQEFAVIALLASMKTKILGLTGTIFNQNVSKLVLLLAYTNMDVLCSTDVINSSQMGGYAAEELGNLLMNAAWFYRNIWRYIGSQISLKDVEKKRDMTHEVNQTVMPLKGLQLTDEQSAWQNLAKTQMKLLNVSQNRQDKLITSYLDFPSQTQIDITQQSRMIPEFNIYSKSKFFIGMQLTPIKIQDTAKFKQLQDILAKNPAKTLIFVQDKQLLDKLPQHLNNTTSLSKSIKKEQVAPKLNELFKDYDNVIVTSSQVNVGIDVNNAQNVIWYQVPGDVAAIIQANRRVLRLNSTTASKVWYLYYKDTEQEKIITEVSKSAVNNAAAYSSRLDDNLARATKVLFGNLG